MFLLEDLFFPKLAFLLARGFRFVWIVLVSVVICMIVRRNGKIILHGGNLVFCPIPIAERDNGFL